MMISDLIKHNRSFRRFLQNERIERNILLELIDLARLSPSAANRQPLKYKISNDPKECARVFPALAWAGYLRDWPGPDDGERPAAYITIVLDTRIAAKVDCDQGIAAQSILLGAVEKKLGGCIIGSIDREELSRVLNLESHHKILLVLAIGKPAETVILEEMKDDDRIEYWREEDGTHHVPKRALERIIL